MSRHRRRHTARRRGSRALHDAHADAAAHGLPSGLTLGDGCRTAITQASYDDTVKCWNISDSCAWQYALYLPGVSLSVTVFVLTWGTVVKSHDLPCGPSSE